MLKKLSENTINNLNFLLATVGDMALKRRARKIVLELELEEKDKILEVGCGNGYYLNLFNKLNFDFGLTGIDSDKLALVDAKKFIKDDRVRLILGDASKIPFKKNSFDKVVMSEVIEHVEDEGRVLSEIYRVLKPKGILVLTTCNINYPLLWDPVNWILQHFFNTHIKSGFWAGIWNQHMRLYKKSDLNKLLKKTLFKIETSEYLTRWCLPFNHYLVNFVARLFYQGSLPKGISKGLNKFESEQGSFLVKSIFLVVNIYDKLNDLYPGKNGVSIFVKVRK